MATLKAEQKRGFLRSLYRQCPDTLDLLAALEAFQDYCFNASNFKSGRLVSATSQAGHSIQFQAPSAVSSFTPDEVFTLSEELLAVYAGSKANLITNGVATPSDEQIFNAMLASNALATVTEEYADYAGAYYANRIM